MELDPLKIIRENLVRTGFMEKYNKLVDEVIYKVETDGSNLIFYTNVDTTIIPMTSSISDLLDVNLDGLTSGQVLLYDGNEWVNVNFNPTDLEYIRDDFSSRSGLTDVGNITSVTDALDKILYPYQPPTFPSFGIGGKSKTLELGQDLIVSGGETPTFTWSTSYNFNVSDTNGFQIDDITGANTLDTVILPKTLTSKAINIPNQIVKTSNGATHTFRITGKNTKDTSFSRNSTYTWRPRRFWGTHPNSGALSSTEIISLASSNTGGSELSTSRTQTRIMSGNSEHFHFYWDASFGDTAGILVGNLPNSAWDKHTVSFTNAYGHTTNYIGYVSHNPSFGSGVKIEMT